MDPVQQQLDAYNARDLEAFLACYAPDLVVEDAAGSPMMQGRDGMRAVYGPLCANSPDLRAEVVARIAVGEFVVDEERVRGLKLPGFPVALDRASGRQAIPVAAERRDRRPRVRRRGPGRCRDGGGHARAG